MLLPSILMQVSLHDPSLTPEMTDQGFVVAPGTHTLVAVNRKQVLTYQPSVKYNQIGIFAGCLVSHRSVFVSADPPGQTTLIGASNNIQREKP